MLQCSSKTKSPLYGKGFVDSKEDKAVIDQHVEDFQ